MDLISAAQGISIMFNWKSQWPIPKVKEFAWTIKSLECGRKGNIWRMRTHISQSKLIGFAFVRLLPLRLAFQPTRMDWTIWWVGRGPNKKAHKSNRKRKEAKAEKWRLDWFSHCNLTLKHVVFVDWWCKLAFKPTPLLFHLNHTTLCFDVFECSPIHIYVQATMYMVLYQHKWVSTRVFDAERVLGMKRKNCAGINVNNGKEKSIYLLVFANKLGSCFT